MARASFYYYVPGSWCLFCIETTDETRVITNPVQDLAERTVGIPCHRACWRRKVLGSWLRFAAAFLLVTLALTGLELFLLRFGKPARLHSISAALIILNLAVGLIAGAVTGLTAHGRVQKKIQDYIQLRTYPYD